MAPECQEKNAKGLTMAVVGMGKAAEELVILDERTRADLASGKYHDQRRGSFGAPDAAPTARAGQAVVPAQRPAVPSRPVAPSRPAVPSRPVAPSRPAAPSRPVAPSRPARQAQTRPPRHSPARPPARGPWTRRQEKLALLYNEQGIKPAEIAERLGVSSYLVTQIILAAKNRGKI